MAVKIDEADILGLMENLVALLESCTEGFRECEDRHQCMDVFETVRGQVLELMTAFRVNHVVREPKKGEVMSLPGFVVERNRIAHQKSYDGISDQQLNAYEDRMHFKAQFYRMVNTRLSDDPALDSLYSLDALRAHIGQVAFDDAKLSPYLVGHFWAEAEDVLDTIAEGIVAYRARYPQMAIVFPVQYKNGKENGSLLDSL